MNCDASELLPSLQLPARLTSLSTSISQLTNLQHLTIRGANQMRQLPDVLGGLSSLLKLELIGKQGGCSEF
jgi:Leucine-rich repeat (LRR) protein